MNNETVSIIIPVYNAEVYLRQCLDSVISQTYQNLQIILVNDGSTDNSAAICEEYKVRDGRIRVIHKVNEGAGLARNEGLKYVEGKYVTFVDSDDWISLDRIERLVIQMKDVNADVVIGGNTKCRNDGSVIGKTELPFHGLYENDEIREKIMLALIAADDTSKRDLGIPMSVWSNLYLFSIIKENMILFSSEREYVSEDLFFNLEFLKYARRVLMSYETGYNYRYNPMSITRKFDENQIQRTYCFYQKLKSINLGITDLRIKRCVIAKLRSLLLMIMHGDNTLEYKLHKMREILESDTSREVLCNYPLTNYRFSLKITTLLMKNKKVYLLYFIMLLKDWMEKRK